MRILVVGNQRTWADHRAADILHRGNHTVTLAHRGQHPAGRHDLVLIQYDTDPQLAAAARNTTADGGAVILID